MLDSECLVAACASSEFLIQSFSHECGIFGSTPSSHNIVRNLIKRVTQGSPRAIRDENNPHIVVAVLIYSLKLLKFSLFHEVLAEITKVSVTDGAYDSIKASVQTLLVKVSQDRLRVIRLIVEYVVNLLASRRKVGGSGDRRPWGADGNNKEAITPQSMAQIVASLTCRPFGTSYLSIKHKECANQAAPVIMFILENFEDVFGSDLKSMIGIPRTEEQLQATELAARGESFARIRRKGGQNTAGEGMVVAEMDRRPGQSSGDQPVDSLGRVGEGTDFGQGATSETGSGEEEEGVMSPRRRKRRPSSPQPSVPSSPKQLTQQSPPSRSGWEWNVLESIVLSRVRLFTAGKLDINSASLRSPTSAETALAKGDGMWTSTHPNKPQNADSPFSSSSSSSSSFGNADCKENINANAATRGAVSPAGGSKFSWGGGGAGVMAAQQHAQQATSSSPSSPAGSSGSSSSHTKGTASARRAEDGPSSAGPYKKSRSNYSFTPQPVSKPVSEGQNSRRRAVAECRAIKTQINAWETEFSLSYAASHGGRGKSPRASDRPKDVQMLYDRYKEMKKSIRDSAATDVQRTVRCMLAKKRVFALKESIRRGKMYGDIMSLSSVLAGPLGSPRSGEGSGSESSLTGSPRAGGASPDTTAMLLEAPDMALPSSASSASAGVTTTTTSANTATATAVGTGAAAGPGSSSGSRDESPRHTVASSVEILSKSGARSGTSAGAGGAPGGGRVESSLYTSSDSAYSISASGSTSMVVAGSAASSRNNSVNLTSSSINSMSITDASTTNLMLSISAPNSVNNSVNASAMDMETSALMHTANSQSSSGGDANNTNNSNSSSDGRISPSGVNIMSSLSFEAGLNINQAASIRGLREDDTPSPALDPTSGSGGPHSSEKQRPAGPESSSSISGSSIGGAQAEQLKERYQDCLARKRELKRVLKRFDESFQASHGGLLPKKADKEVMRPQYQQYHDSKGELDALKAQIVQVLGHFPEHLLQLENKAPAGLNANTNTASSRVERTPGTPVQHQPPQQQQQASGGSPRPSGSTPASAKGQGVATKTPSAAGMLSAAQGSPSPIRAIATPPPGATTTESPASSVPESAPSDEELAGMSTTQLMEEKKNLHAYLKTYERNFQTEHKRPVTKQDDIAPVSSEYHRYKTLKSLVAQRKDQERVAKAAKHATTA